ncbi:MAG: hypothetical protein V3V08_03630 [Nannocystaceae bacterium]
MLRSRRVVEAAGRYLRDHPDELRTALKNALDLRFGVPMAAFGWLAAEFLHGSSKVHDVKIEPVPPGIRVAATFEKMQTRLRGSADIFVDRVTMGAGTMCVEIRMESVALELAEDADTAVAALIKSGALDLSRPATLLGYLVRSPVLLRAEGNAVALELMAHPRLAHNPHVSRALTVLASLVEVRRVAADPGHLEVTLRGLPGGLMPAVEAVRENVIAPGWRRVRSAIMSATALDDPPPRSRFRRMLNAVTAASR